jgi:glucose-1-phosphate thymidylyltransferase
MKGIVLAGGTGSRLWPITSSVSKQLLPVYDKPMIYYPIATLMLAGVRNILIITTPHDQSAFQNLLGDGSQFGIRLEYAVQDKPAGLAQAFIIGARFLNGESCLMILGDNIFHGAGLGSQLQKILPSIGAHIFTYEVATPSEYGVLNLDLHGLPVSVEEKPKNPTSNLAVTGLYFFDDRVSQIAQEVMPSARGELEITSVINWYLQRQELSVTQLSRGTAWLDTGTPEGLQDASTYIKVIEERTGLKIACLEEIAYNLDYITQENLEVSVIKYLKSTYGSYLKSCLSRKLTSKLDQ